MTDFPMFEYDDAAQRWNAVHHPFTSPKDGHEDWLESDPGRCIAKAYDVVLNGIELGGGSVRIHREEVQSKVFARAQHRRRGGAGQVRLPARRAAVWRAAARRHRDRPGPLRHALMTGAESLRDVIAFPKTQRAVPADARAEPGRRQAAARVAHPAEESAAGLRTSIRRAAPCRDGRPPRAAPPQGSAFGAGGRLHAGARRVAHRARRPPGLLAERHRREGPAARESYAATARREVLEETGIRVAAAPEGGKGRPAGRCRQGR